MLSNTGSLAQQYNPRELEGRQEGDWCIWHSSIFFEREYYMRGVVRERLFCRTAQSVCVLAACARTAFLCNKTVKSRYDGTVRPLAEKTSGLPPLGLAPPFSAFLIAPRHTLSAFFTAASALPSSSANRPHSIRAS